MSKADADDLEAFALARAQTSKAKRCWVCNLEERPAIDEALRKGVSIYAVTDWLEQKKGKPGAFHRVKGHRLGKHHEQ